MFSFGLVSPSYCHILFLPPQRSACSSIRLLLSYTGAVQVLLATSMPLARTSNSTVTPQVFQASFYHRIYQEGRKTNLCYYQNTVRQASPILFHTLLTLRNRLKPGKCRIMFIPSVNSQPSEISQQLKHQLVHMYTSPSYSTLENWEQK